MKSGTSSFWVIVMSLGILACLGGVVYTFFMIQQEAGQEGEYRVAADEMRLLSQQMAANARESVQGEEATFNELGKNMESFNCSWASCSPLPSIPRWKKSRRIGRSW